jgi:peptidoglycan/LPS O-acetylase OafA/YrhL
MSAPGRTFPTLNAVRGIGALMVLTTHAAFNTGQILRGWTGGPLARLDFGVPLFFVLSGFLLSRPFFLAIGRGERHPSYRHYLWKRALRILPLYWAIVVVALLFDPANHGLGWEVWVRQLTLTQLYFPTLLPESLTQMWSLCTEVLFYLLMPLTAYLLTASRRRRGLHLPTVWVRGLVLTLLALAWQSGFAHVPGSEGHYLQWLPGWMPQFLVGMCFAAVSADLTLRPRIERPHLLDRMGTDLAGCWILAAALFAISCTPVAGPRTLAQPNGWESGSKDLLYTLAAAFFVLPLMFGPELAGRVRPYLAGRVPTWLGDISYGVYAIHLFVMGVLFRVLDIVPFTGHFFTILLLDAAVTLVVATASWRFFESPILRLKNLRWMMRIEPPATRADLEFQEHAQEHHPDRERAAAGPEPR